MWHNVSMLEHVQCKPSDSLYPFVCFFTERPDFTDAIILRKGASVEHVVISLLFIINYL